MVPNAVRSWAKAKPIDVLIYAPFTGNGGVRRFVLSMLKTFLATTEPADWRFRVLGQPVDGSGEPIDWPDGAFLPLCGGAMANHLGAGLIPFLVSHQDRFFADLRRHSQNANIVWLTQPWWTMRVRQEIVDLPAHIVPTVHDYAFDSLDWHGPLGDGFRAEARAFIEVASHSIFSSHCTRQAAIDRYGMQADDGSVIYLADFVPDSFTPTPSEAERVARKYGLPPCYWLAFHAVGHKDPLTIVEAVGSLRAARPDLSFPLVIAGANTDRMRPDAPDSDPYTESVRKAFARFSLQYGTDYVIPGFVADADIAGLYGGALACIAASRSEAGLSGTIFEAFRARTPLVFSDIAPFLERLGVERRFGLHFAVGQCDDLARQLATLCDDPSGRRRRADAAFELTSQRAWKDVALDYLEVFERLVRRGPTNRIYAPAAPAQVAGPCAPRTTSFVRRICRKLLRQAG